MPSDRPVSWSPSSLADRCPSEGSLETDPASLSRLERSQSSLVNRFGMGGPNVTVEINFSLMAGSLGVTTSSLIAALRPAEVESDAERQTAASSFQRAPSINHASSIPQRSPSIDIAAYLPGPLAVPVGINISSSAILARHDSMRDSLLGPSPGDVNTPEEMPWKAVDIYETPTLADFLQLPDDASDVPSTLEDDEFPGILGRLRSGTSGLLTASSWSPDECLKIIITPQRGPNDRSPLQTVSQVDDCVQVWILASFAVLRTASAVAAALPVRFLGLWLQVLAIEDRACRAVYCPAEGRRGSAGTSSVL